MQRCAARYHANMELMASESSALLDLSMQHVSIQMYGHPSSRARWALLSILAKPFIWPAAPVFMCSRVTSSSSHRCERTV